VESWPQRTFVKHFETDEELLIDNFMDPTHTGTVHAGLIRTAEDACQHEVTLTTHEKGVAVDFEETQERVGVGMRWMLGRSIRVRHRDEFLLPNIVRVKYWFNDQLRFVALIACNAVGRNEDEGTLALVQLRYQFGLWNFAAGMGLRYLAPKILRQDFEITKDQFQNRKRFPDKKDRLVAADAVSVRMRELRQRAAADDIQNKSIVQKLKLRF
jgi:phenylpropionate dioxygenase-like ring-hydroxylating dioxygenase large terminal subunit